MQQVRIGPPFRVQPARTLGSGVRIREGFARDDQSNTNNRHPSFAQEPSDLDGKKKEKEVRCRHDSRIQVRIPWLSQLHACIVMMVRGRPPSPAVQRGKRANVALFLACSLIGAKAALRTFYRIAAEGPHVTGGCASRSSIFAGFERPIMRLKPGLPRRRESCMPR